MTWGSIPLHEYLNMYTNKIYIYIYLYVCAYLFPYKKDMCM